MNGEIIAVGSELLLGQIANTNAQFLSKQLADIGINVFYHTVAGDNSNRLKSVIKIAEQRSNLIILTGGLGPTKDDLTKETVASHLGKRLVLNEQALASIQSYFQKTNRQLTENSRKQALVIEGSEILPNDYGMAPGMVIKTKECVYMLLPGPPKELEPMFLKYGKAALLNGSKTNGKIISRVLRFFGIGEAALETKIEDLINEQKNPTIAPLASDGEVVLRLTASHSDNGEATRLLDEAEKKILARVGQFFYGYDSSTLFHVLSDKLKKAKLTIAAAESLTGGLFQQELTAIPGASTIFKGGVVCYATEIKRDILKVKDETIREKGVVSPECAAELAENIRKLMSADVGISFTGVAGPDSQEGKPVGTVFIGVSIAGKTEVKEFQLGGTRDAIRLRTAKHGSFLLLKVLKTYRPDVS